MKVFMTSEKNHDRSSPFSGEDGSGFSLSC